jgi:hypothetical protein
MWFLTEMFITTAQSPANKQEMSTISTCWDPATDTAEDVRRGEQATVQGRGIHVLRILQLRYHLPAEAENVRYRRLATSQIA